MTALRRAMRAVAGAWAGALALTLAAASPGSAAAQAGSLEYAVKANYLVRFGAFVQWPERTLGASGAPVVICVVGQDPFGAVLDQAVAGQTVNGRPLQARRLDRIDARSGCHLAYLGRSTAQSQAQALAALAGTPVLTVTDSAQGSARGMIHFAVDANRVRFHVDDEAAARAGLSISSRLLGLALSVRSREGT